MKTVELPTELLHEAPWNVNQMTEVMLLHLKESLNRYGIVVPLVTRRIGNGGYEVLSGNQRLAVLRELGIKEIPCVLVDLNDSEARLLAQVLNGIHGEDDPVFKGKLFQEMLEKIPAQEVLNLLPETAASLSALSSFKEVDLTEHLKMWERTRAARLEHLPLRLTPPQRTLVEKAIKRMIPQARIAASGNPNVRSEAIFLICKKYLEQEGET